MSNVDPTGSDLKRFLEDDPGGPVTMLNLLRFKPDGGRESYNKYAKAIIPFLEKVGGEVLYLGDTSTPLVQPPSGNDWDAVLLVTYPSRQAFSQMVADPEYQQITHLRTEALQAAVLQPTTPKRG
jgi:uncharacterized protein (DUF1330 family)